MKWVQVMLFGRIFAAEATQFPSTLRKSSPPSEPPTSQPSIAIILPRQSQSNAPTKFQTNEPSLQPTLAHSNYPSHSIAPSVAPTFFTPVPTRYQPFGDLEKSFVMDILLELPGMGIMNETETTAFQQAILKVLATPSCRTNEEIINSSTIHDQSLANNNTMLYLWMHLNVTAKEKYHIEARRRITECVKNNGQTIKLNYMINMGHIKNSPKDDNSLFGFGNHNLMMIILIVGCAISALGLLLGGVCYIQKRKKRKLNRIDEILEGGPENMEYFNNNPVQFSSSQSTAQDDGLGDIEHILSMVLSRPDQGSQKSNESSLAMERIAQNSHSTASSNGIVSDVELQSLGFVEKMKTESRDPSAIQRSIATHVMHSEGLTFQPIVENGYERTADTLSTNYDEGMVTENLQNEINYVREVQKMVLESRNCFFDEEENFQDNVQTRNSPSSSTNDNMITKFSKRIMYTLSPKNKDINNCSFL